MEHTGFQHEALIYEDAEGYLAGTVPFLRAALEAGEPTLVAVGPDQTELLEGELGEDATRVRFVDYVVASAGMLPGTSLYVYYGQVAGDVFRLAGGATVRHDFAYYAVLALGLLATAILTAVVTRTARRALRDATDPAAAHAG